MKVYVNPNDLWLGTKNVGQFMIFELPLYLIHVLNFELVAHESQLPP